MYGSLFNVNSSTASQFGIITEVHTFGVQVATTCLGAVLYGILELCKARHQVVQHWPLGLFLKAMAHHGGYLCHADSFLSSEGAVLLDFSTSRLYGCSSSHMGYPAIRDNYYGPKTIGYLHMRTPALLETSISRNAKSEDVVCASPSQGTRTGILFLAGQLPILP